MRGRRLLYKMVVSVGLLCAVGVLAFVPTAMAQAITLPNIQLVTTFPDGWTIVTPDTAARYSALLGVSSEVAADVMNSDNVVVAAFGTGADIAMRVRMTQTDASEVYFDIDRYTTAMRNAIRADYLDAEAWKLTGLRFSEAEWRNPAKAGRYLRLTYTRRSEGEIVARGLMAFTVHNGREITLQIEATGRQLSSKEIALFDTWLGETAYTPELDMPMLPTGLAFSEPFVQESISTTVRIKGTTQVGALVTGSLIEGDNAPFPVGETTAKAGGAFTLTLTLPREGAWTLVVESALEGYETTRYESALSVDSKRIPINLSAPLEGDVWDAQPRLVGKTLAQTEITVSDNGNISKRTTSEGDFSIKLSPEPAGTRVVTVTLKKRGYDERTIKYVFERRWHTEEYAAYLKTQVKATTYANLAADPGKYAGRIVSFTGLASEVSTGDGSSSIRLQTAPGKADPGELYCVAEEELMVEPDRTVTVYGIITGETYTIPETDDAAAVTLPIVRVLLVVE